MQPTLPTSLDMASARVLGFDATAYIYDQPSTLHQRLNIPNYVTNDYFTSDRATPGKKSYKDFAAAIAGVLTIAGGTILSFIALKGKIKIPKKLNNILPNKKLNIKNGTKNIFNRVYNNIVNAGKKFANSLKRSRP